MINLTNNMSAEEQLTSLADVVNTHDDEILELTSNVKWLYKYGGAGTGGGTGGGNNQQTTKEFQANVSFDGLSYWIENDTAMNDVIYPTNGKDTYHAVVLLRYADASHTYVFLYRQNGASYYTTFSLDETGLAVLPIQINGNGSLEIRIRDTYSAQIRSITLRYIVDYVVVDSLLLVDQDHKKVIANNNEILMSTYNLLYALLKFELAVAGILNYKYKDLQGVEGLGQATTSDTIYIPLHDTNFLKDVNNLGYYTFNVELEYAPMDTGLYKPIDLNALSLSLIPSSLYVQVVPDSGNIYMTLLTIYNTELGHFDKTNTQNPYVFLSGYRTFKIKIFNGSYDGDMYSELGCALYKGDILINLENNIAYSVEERAANTYTIYVLETAEEPLEYHLNVYFKDVNLLEHNVTYYLYIKLNEADFKWIEENKSVISENYFNRSGFLDTIFTNYNKYILLTDSGESVTCPLSWDTDAGNNARELAINIGILYSDVNKANTLIASITREDGKAPIYIYQNSDNSALVKINAETLDMYIPRCAYTDYNKASENYHLLTLYRRIIKIVGTDIYYEWDAYVDGVLEHTVYNYVLLGALYERITFNPTPSLAANFIINHVGIYEFTIDLNTILSAVNLNGISTYSGLSDMDIVLYYYKYKNSMSTVINTHYAEVLNSLLGFKYDYDSNGLRNPYIRISETMMNSIASTSGIPAILVKIPSQGSDEVLDTISNTDYGEEDTFKFENCDVRYRAEGTDTSFMSHTLSENLQDASIAYTMALLGSSTKAYRVKNFSLGVVARNPDTNVIPVYSFNYDQNDPDSFYPEAIFTLKADLVDSSHSNNTTCGAFINEYTKPFHEGKKNCLLGYPVLLFILDLKNSDVDNYYLLGIYNFNLGRDSLNNLGHAEKSTNFENRGFIVEGLATNNLKDDFIVAEIANNTAYWDFSLFDDSILFEGMCYETDACENNLESVGKSDLDTLFMWDDIKFRETLTFNTGVIRNAIKSLVKTTAETGGALFEAIGKEFEHTLCYPENSKGESASYHIYNTVPDYKQLYKRYLIVNLSSGNYYGYAGNSYTPLVTLSQTLLDCIFRQEGEDGSTKLPKIDYTSLLQYYVVCMALGLVDSVQKNLNIKTWNAGDTWYIAFYDMDTSFGIDNSGKYISAFAFSDYWTTENGEIKVCRDYWDANDKTNVGYDIPSSYLFAIAKYAEYVRRVTPLLANTAQLSTPTKEWSDLRSSTGLLRSAGWFVDNYFAKHANAINEVVWNMNYRYKYLQTDKDNPNQFVAKDFSFFHGRRINYTKDWLNKRLRILDAYFNLNNIAFAIDENSVYTEVNPALNAGINSNDDIKILRLIFNGGSPDQIKNNGSINSYVKVNEFSPLIISSTNNVSRFLLTEPNQEYNIFASMMGNLAFAAYGSDSWTYLDSLNCYVTDKLAMNIRASLLENIEADVPERSATSWTFTCPALKKLSLTGPKFTGPLSLYNCDNLEELNISGTSITLNKTNVSNNLNVFPSLKKLNLGNVTAPESDFSITNATLLTELNVNEASMLSLTINPINTNCTLVNTNIKSISLSGAATAENIKVSITNDNTVETLTLTNVSEIVIDHCPKLKTLIIDSKVTKLHVLNCGNLALTIGDTAGITDLTKCTALRDIAFSGTYVVQVKLYLRYNIEIAKGAFSNCTHLLTINGYIKVMDGEECFANCCELDITNSATYIKFDENVTSLAGMFKMTSARGKINNTALTKIYNALTTAGIINKITSFKETFYYNSITSPSNFLQSSSTTRFTKCTDFTSMFAYNPITETISSYMLNIGSDELTNINLMFNRVNKSPSAAVKDVTDCKLILLINALDYLLNRLKELSFGLFTPISISGYTTVPLATFIGKCTLLTTISSLTFIENTKINFAKQGNYYAVPTTVTSIDGFLRYTTYAYNFELAFINLTNLVKMTGDCFCNVIIKDSNDLSTSVNIYNLFPWSTIINLLSEVFNEYNYNNYKFLKNITLALYISLMDMILQSTSLTVLGCLFTNCTLTDYTSSSQYYLNVITINTPEYSNGRITTLNRTFENFKPSIALDYIDFLAGYFKKFTNCIKYNNTWANTRLFRLYSNWFLTNSNTRIESYSGAFSSTIFKIPYSNIKKTTNKEYYHTNYSFVHVYDKSTGADTGAMIGSSYNTGTSYIKNRSIPAGWDCHYMVRPELLQNASNSCDASYMFAESNLFGFLPEDLFRWRIGNVDYSLNSNMNISYMFSHTWIVPYKVTDLYRLYEVTEDGLTIKKLHRIHVYCMVPNGTETEPYITTLDFKGTFASDIIIPNSYDLEYFVMTSDLNNLITSVGSNDYPTTVLEVPIYDAAYIDQKLTSGEIQYEDYKAINEINMIYVYNLYSFEENGNYSEILPQLLPRIFNDDGTSYLQGFSWNDNITFQGNSKMSAAHKCYINAKYNGGDTIIDDVNNNGLGRKDTLTTITASGLISTYLISLYFGNIFKTNITTSNINLGNANCKVIPNWNYTGDYNAEYTHNRAATITSRHIQFPRALVTVKNWTTVITDQYGNITEKCTVHADQFTSFAPYANQYTIAT